MSKVFTPVLVDRTPQFFGEQPAERKCYWLAIRCEYDAEHDRFTSTVDGQTRTWYRRGMPWFQTWSECCDWSRGRYGYPNG